MSTALASPRVSLAEIIRRNDIVRFGLDIISDDQGWRSYQLCVNGDRHYTVRFKQGETPRLVKGFVPCDRGKCSDGKPWEVSDPEFLSAVGIYQRLGKDEVLVVEMCGSCQTFDGGQIVHSINLRCGKLLGDGQSVQFERRLDNPINLTPDRRFNRKIISTITDTIRTSEVGRW